MNCEWCREEIEGPLQYKEDSVNACDKYCAHDIKNLEKLEEELGIIDKNMPTPEEQLEILEELNNPYGFVR